VSYAARIKRWTWVLVPALALIELSGQARIRDRAVSADDWRAATGYVRREWREKDLLVGAPAWTDPMVRLAAPDLLGVDDAGRSDLSAYERVWELSIRGGRSRELVGHRPVSEVEVGPVTIRRFDLGTSPVVYDFVGQLGSARVELIENGRARQCQKSRSRAIGGGLYAGSLLPEERFVCGGQSWQWVGATVQEDRDLLPRYCVWTHPSGAEPVRVTYDNAPLGERFVFYTGLYRAQERAPYGGPVQMTVKVDDGIVGQRWHRAGAGWSQFEVDTRNAGNGSGRGRVAIEVSAPEPYHRTFCWSGSVHAAAAGERR
jgi:hypothetical protein